MKRYALLAGEQYYPAGWHDFKRFADTPEEAAYDAEKDGAVDWWEIVDLETGKIHAEGDTRPKPAHQTSYDTDHRSDGQYTQPCCSCGWRSRWFLNFTEAQRTAARHLEEAEVKP